MGPASRVKGPRLNVSLGLFIAATTLLAVGGLVLSWRQAGPPKDLLAVSVLTGLGLLSELLKEKDVGGRVGFSNLSIIVLASIPLVGPIGAAAVGALTLAIVPPRVPLIRRYFNSVMHVVLGTVGGSVYILVSAQVGLGEVQGVGPLLQRVALPLLVADLLQMVCNAALVAGVLRSERGLPFRVTFTGMVTTSGPVYLGYGVVGFLLVVLWVPAGVGPFSAFLILAPLSVARWAIVQYGDEVRSHESALSALVTAVETKDPHAAGHSQRVAQIVDWLIEPLGLSVPEVSALRFAAMLHDVGRVSLPTRIVRSPGDLTREELVALAEHGAHGVALLRGVTFLEESLDGILHHHERWDGRGYPDGLAGDSIPLISRVIGVADAFDALTSPRAHRPALTAAEAMAHIESRSSTQFDPHVVEALRRGVDRHPWPTRREVDDDLAQMAGYFDHDDPVASDLYATLVSDEARAPRVAYEPSSRTS